MEQRTITNKEDARQYAIDWQHWASEQSLSFGELYDWQSLFRRLADRYNLTEEFKENGII